MTKNPKRAILLGILMWIALFIAGSVVMNTLGKENIGKVLIFIGPILNIPLAYWYLKKYNTSEEGFKLGVAWVILNIILDTLIYVFAFKIGWGYFSNFTVWVGYIEIIVVSGIIGKILENNKKTK